MSIFVVFKNHSTLLSSNHKKQHANIKDCLKFILEVIKLDFFQKDPLNNILHINIILIYANL